MLHIHFILQPHQWHYSIQTNLHDQTLQTRDPRRRRAGPSIHWQTNSKFRRHDVTKPIQAQMLATRSMHQFALCDPCLA
jgi:hypothetical protein